MANLTGHQAYDPGLGPDTNTGDTQADFMAKVINNTDVEQQALLDILTALGLNQNDTDFGNFVQAYVPDNANLRTILETLLADRDTITYPSFASLPASGTVGQEAIVLATTGVWPNRKPAGLYTFDGTNWNYTGSVEDVGKMLGTFKGSSATADGDRGLVPKPAQGDHWKFLRGDGYFQSLTSTVTFDIPDWGAASGGYYTLTIMEPNHGNPNPTLLVVQLDIGGGSYQQVQPDSAVIQNNNDIVLKVPATPDGRFKGRIVIL